MCVQICAWLVPAYTYVQGDVSTVVEVMLTGELTWVCGPEGQETCARTDLFSLTTPAAPTVVTWTDIHTASGHPRRQSGH